MLVYSNKLNSDFKIATVLAVSHKPSSGSPCASLRWSDLGCSRHHVRDDAPPTIGATKIISSRNLSVRKNEML